jgi:hypothetical protein
MLLIDTSTIDNGPTDILIDHLLDIWARLADGDPAFGLNETARELEWELQHRGVDLNKI